MTGKQLSCTVVAEAPYNVYELETQSLVSDYPVGNREWVYHSLLKDSVSDINPPFLTICEEITQNEHGYLVWKYINEWESVALQINEAWSIEILYTFRNVDFLTNSKSVRLWSGGWTLSILKVFLILISYSSFILFNHYSISIIFKIENLII